MNVDKREIEQWATKLRKLGRTAYPLAVRSTLSTMAFRTTKRAKEKHLPEKFSLRNSYIRKSVQYDRGSNTLNINQMKAKAGQVARHNGKPSNQLQKQEFGGVDRPKRRYLKTALPQARTQKSWGSKVGARSKINKIDNEGMVTAKSVTSYAKGRTRKSTGRAKAKQIIAVAIANKKKYVMFTSSNNNKVIARIRSRAGRGKKKGTVKMTVLYRLDEKRVNKPKPWLSPSVDDVTKQANEIFIKEAERRFAKVMSRGKI